MKRFKMLMVMGCISMALCACGKTSQTNVTNKTTEAQSNTEVKQETTESTISITNAEDIPVVKQIIEANGKVKSEEFTSCIGGMPEAYPDFAYGFVTSFMKDINKDGKEELFVLEISKDCFIVMTVYEEKDGNYNQIGQSNIGYLENFTQQDIVMFYNEKEGSYYLFADTACTGSYTGVVEYKGSLFKVSYDASGIIEAKDICEWNSVIGGDNLIQQGLEAAGVPYAKNCAQFGSVSGDYEVLMTVEHRADNVAEYANRNNYLKIVPVK